MEEKLNNIIFFFSGQRCGIIECCLGLFRFRSGEHETRNSQRNENRNE